MGSERQAEPSRRLTPERWRDVNRVVDVALELRPEERHEYVARECAQDAELRREVEQFLKACDNIRDAPGFLGEPASQYSAPLIAQVDQNDEQVSAAMLQMITAALAPRYIVERELGRGGMARVYLAHDNQLDRRVAIKLMNDDLSRTMGAERFLREIRITASLRHLNIVPVYDSGNVEGFLYYVMPHIEGESLFAKLRREPKLSLADALRIVRDVADALDYAHAHGIVHRDVKPQNILIESGRALVTDFGVALVVTSLSADPVTQSVALGTPKYMSPEQASGDQELTPRSDVYALGVVLYEMLAGEPPYSGGSAQAVLAKHMHAAIPDIRILRRNLGAEVQRVTERALAKVPAERYVSAGNLARDFEAAVTATTADAPRSRSLARIGVVTAVAVVLGLLARFVPTIITQPTPAARMDTTRVAVLRLHRDPIAQQRAADDAMLREGLARWRGVAVLDPSTTDALANVAASTSVAQASAVARSLGAGRFIRGSIAPRGNGWRAEAALFDAETGRARHQSAVDVPAFVASAKRAYEQLADALLLRGDDDTTQERRFWSLSLPAMQAMRHGQRALDAWDLVVADSLFQVSVGLDPAYPRANLLLSQVRAWRSLPASSWSTLAERAYDGIATLPERERQLARPLVLLARRQFAAACREYEQLESANRRDFAGKFGLGQCRTMDNVVVPDASSPSGWRFRSSYYRAVLKYADAFEILPSAHHGYEHDGFARLRALLFLSTDLVNGYGADKQRTLYHARPSWQGDTLALIPYRWDEMFAGGNRTIPRGFEEALARQRTAFRRITASWSTAFPRSSGPKLAVGIALELLNDASAIDTIRLARQLAQDSTRELDSIRELRLAAMEALLRVKFAAPDDTAELRKARALIDSALMRPVTLASEASIVAPLAALAGRCQLAEDLFRRVDPAIAGLPGAPHLFARSQALLARSALGCADRPSTPRLADFAATIERENAGATDDERRWMDAALLFRPALLSPTLDSAVIERLAAGSQNQLLLAARALVRRDSSRARQELTAFGAHWNRTIGVTPDIGYVEATFWARLRDTTAAMLWLDRTLGSAPTYDPAILADPTRAAVFVRAMLLRAELAQQRGDLPAARRWAAAVAIMWSGADEDLRPSMQRVERIASSR